MTTTELTERTVKADGKPIFVSETGTGPAVVMLHGGGPGASGVSNYSRNIDALSAHCRVIVPDMPGYGRSVKGVDQDDPFGYLADMIRGLLDELGVDTAHLIGNSRGGPAARARHPAPCGQACLDGSRRDRHDQGRSHGRVEEPAVLLRRRRPESRQARHVHPHLSGVRRRRGARGPHRPALPGIHRPGGDRGPAAAPPVRTKGPAHPMAEGSHSRQPAEGTHDADARSVGPRRQGQPPPPAARCCSTCCRTRSW